MIGQSIWRVVTPTASIKDGLKMAFANDDVPVPDQFVDDFRKLTFDSYKKTFDESERLRRGRRPR